MTEPERTLEPDRLRDLLEDAVADVQPTPALDRIRARTKVRPMRRTRPWFLVTAGAVAATAATITVVSLANRPSPPSDSGPGPAATATVGPSDPGTEDPSGAATPAPSETPSSDADTGPGAGTVALPVYFVGDTPTGPRLFREFHEATVEAGWTDRLVVALDQAVHGEATDEDYRSGWPATADGALVAEVRRDAGDIRLVLAGRSDLTGRPAGMTADQARLAVQQVVYTAQAVVQERLPVVFADPNTGQPLDTLLGVDVSPQVEAAPALEVQAPVWVISPQDNEQVERSFTVEGRGAFFEADVSWQLLRDDGTVVKDGFATAQECCILSPYSFEVTAPPGDYVLRVFDADVSGGEGPGEQQDTKRIFVR